MIDPLCLTAVLGGTITYGDGAPWFFDATNGIDPLAGLFDANVRANNAQRRHGDGSVKGPDFNDEGIVQLPFIARHADATLANANLLRSQWRALGGATKTILVITDTNTSETWTVIGSPLGAKPQLGAVSKARVLRAMCTFEFHDGVIT